MKPKHTNLEGKVAVVTGGGGVLCGSMARELAKHGMKIAILNYPKEFGDKTAEDINNAGGEAISVFCDVTKPDRSEEHTSELQSRGHLVCRLLLDKKKEENT